MIKKGIRKDLTNLIGNRRTIRRIVQSYIRTTVARYIGVLSWMVQTLAPRHNWLWLSEVQADLHQMAEPRCDNRARVVHATDPPELGLNLMVKADVASPADPRAAARTARDFRDELMSALLSMRPPRQKNIPRTVWARLSRDAGTERAGTDAVYGMRLGRRFGAV